MVPSEIRWLFIFQIWFVEFVFSAEIFYSLGPSNSCSGKHFICCFSVVPDVFASLTDLSLNICVWDETRSLIIVKHLMKAQNHFSIGTIISKIEKKWKILNQTIWKWVFFLNYCVSIELFFVSLKFVRVSWPWFEDRVAYIIFNYSILFIYFSIIYLLK